MWIVRFALRFPHTFYVLAMLILFLGVSAVVGMSTDIFPEINIPVVSVIWQYTGLSTPEMEQRVSTYSQYSISANVNGIKNMEAQTLNGLSIQKIYFQPDVNLDLAIAQIVSATNAIRALMPPGIQPTIVVQFNASSVPVLQLSLNSDTLNEQQLYDFGIYKVRQQLAPVPGVTLPTRSPDYLGSYETIRRAEAQTRMALASLLPVVTGQGSYTHNFNQIEVPFNGATLVTPPSNVWQVAATGSWTPINARAYYDYESTKKNVDVAQLTFEDKRRQIAASVVASMLATMSSARVAELNRVGLRSALERLHLTEARLQYGQGTPLDVDRANEDVAASRRLILDGDESLRRARESLGVALGSKDPISVATDLDLEAFERAVASTCHLNDAIEKRPDISSLGEKVAKDEATRKSVGSEKPGSVLVAAAQEAASA